MEDDVLFTIAWARMPLPKEELSMIDRAHRTRPYLLCLDKGNYYYAFPCTSHVYDNNIRYENEKVIIHSRKSTLIKLGELVKLPKTNLESSEIPVGPDYENEIIKKVSANSFYKDYPSDFMDFIDEQTYYCEIGDIIEIDGDLFVIVGDKDNKNFTVYPVYTFPVKGSVEIPLDGLKFYVDVFSSKRIRKNDDYRYFSQINLENIGHKKGLLKYLLQAPVVQEEKDYSIFGQLEPGMIISYDYQGYTNRLIVLENNGSDLEVLVGDEDQIYHSFQPINLPTDINFYYEIVGTLGDERLEQLTELKHEKLYDDLVLRRDM